MAYLEPLREIAETGRTVADRIREAFPKGPRAVLAASALATSTS